MNIHYNYTLNQKPEVKSTNNERPPVASCKVILKSHPFVFMNGTFLFIHFHILVPPLMTLYSSIRGTFPGQVKIHNPSNES